MFISENIPSFCVDGTPGSVNSSLLPAVTRSLFFALFFPPPPYEDIKTIKLIYVLIEPNLNESFSLVGKSESNVIVNIHW